MLPESRNGREMGKFVESAGKVAVRVVGDLSISSGDKDKIKESSDLAINITYLDLGTDDQRVHEMEYSSLSLNLSFTETFIYGGTTGNFYITSITTS